MKLNTSITTLNQSQAEMHLSKIEKNNSMLGVESEQLDMDSSDQSQSLFSRSFNQSFTSKGSQPKIHNKVDKQKFEFIFKKALFRHLSAYMTEQFKQFTQFKKVHQNKLRSKTEEFIASYFSKTLAIHPDKEKFTKAAIAVLHSNKFNNAIFSDITTEFDLIRGVTQKFN